VAFLPQKSPKTWGFLTIKSGIIWRYAGAYYLGMPFDVLALILTDPLCGVNLGSFAAVILLLLLYISIPFRD
jgi:hypothetical protein